METKHQSFQCKSPTSQWPKKTRQLRSRIKAMVVALFFVMDTIHCEILPQGQTINQHVRTHKDLGWFVLFSARQVARDIRSQLEAASP